MTISDALRCFYRQLEMEGIELPDYIDVDEDLIIFAINFLRKNIDQVRELWEDY